MSTKLQNLVTEALSLDRKISEQSERLKELKADIMDAAREREEEHTPTDGGSQRWTVEGTDGFIARVNFPAPTMKSKIEGEGKAIEKIKQLAGSAFSKLFVPAITFKPTRISAKRRGRSWRRATRTNSSSSPDHERAARLSDGRMPLDAGGKPTPPTRPLSALPPGPASEGP